MTRSPPLRSREDQSRRADSKAGDSSFKPRGIFSYNNGDYSPRAVTASARLCVSTLNDTITPKPDACRQDSP